MKKKVYIGILSLCLLLGSYLYIKDNNSTQDNIESKEVGNFTTDIKHDYDDIIIKTGNSDEKIVALTFDDGPDVVYTPQVLDILKKYDVKATFFVVGENVTFYPKLVEREYKEGHEIGNHTFTHINVEKNGYGEIDKEISKTQEEICKVTGQEPKLFRPPYRALSRSMCDIVKQKNMNIILWSNLDPRDWSNPGVDHIVNTIDQKVKNGNIILLHDYNKVRTPKSQTVKALDIIIPRLKEKGYRFVTVSELMEKMNDIDNK